MRIQKGALAITLSSLIALAIGLGNVETRAQIGARPRAPFSSKSSRVRLVAFVNRNAETSILVLKWSLKNISRVDIRFSDNNLFRDYKITVIDAMGKPVQLTPRGQEELTASYFISQRATFILHPEETKEKEIDIAYYYDVKPERIYTISVERQIATQDGKGKETVQSKPIKFKV